MHTVMTRMYDVDAEGRRFLAYRPGDVVSDADAERLALDLEASVINHFAQQLAQQLPLISPAGANLRGEYIEAIEAGRAERSTPPHER